MIGLSGLITPSLDEMVHVASRDGAPRPDDAAADRRRHDLARRTPRSRSRRRTAARSSTCSTRRAPSASPARSWTPTRREAFAATIQGEYDAGSARARAAHGDRAAPAPSPRLAPTGVKLDWTGVTPPRPTFLGVRTFEHYPLAELVERIDWTPFFATWELRGAYPAILDHPKLGAAARDLHARRPGACWSGSSPRIGCGRTRSSASGPRTRSMTTTSPSGATSRGPSGSRRSARCASRWRSRTAGRTSRSRTSSPRSTRGSRTTSAPSRSPPVMGSMAPTGSSPSSRPPTTTTRRSSPRRSPIAWPRPSPSGSTSASAASCGATRRTRRSRTRT